jgi:hypothetical protein
MAKPKTAKASEGTTDAAAAEPKEAKTKKTRDGKKKKISASKRAGIIFPVGRSFRAIKRYSGEDRAAQTAAVYMAAVGEYLIRELLDGCSRIRVKETTKADGTLDTARHRINPSSINTALYNDVELQKVFGQFMYTVETTEQLPREPLTKDDLRRKYGEPIPKKKKKEGERPESPSKEKKGKKKVSIAE